MNPSFPSLPSVQRKLVLDDAPSLVLSTVNAAREKLRGHDEDDIKGLWEDGRILFAWNIGLGDTIEARLLPASIDAYRFNHSHPSESQVLADLIAALRPLTKADRSGICHAAKFTSWTTSKRLALVLNCSSTHVINLLEAGVLKTLPHTTWGVGPNGAALVTIDSIRSFLQTRRLP